VKTANLRHYGATNDQRHRLIRKGEMIMKRATSFLSTEANRKGRRLAVLAILMAVGVTALSLGSAKQAQAEPPDPCHHECEF
jgi:hypothetical protein